MKISLGKVQRTNNGGLREVLGMMPTPVLPDVQHITGLCQGVIGDRPEHSMIGPTVVLSRYIEAAVGRYCQA